MHPYHDEHQQYWTLMARLAHHAGDPHCAFCQSTPCRCTEDYIRWLQEQLAHARAAAADPWPGFADALERARQQTLGPRLRRWLVAWWKGAPRQQQ